MAYDSLKNIIRQYIKTNGEQEITGQIMQNVLIEMVNNYPSTEGYIRATLSNLANGDILVYDSVGAWYNTPMSSFLAGYATQLWVNQQGYVTSSALAGYIRPTLTDLANGDILIWDSVGAWVNAPLDTTISGFGYVKSTGSVAYATSAGSANILGHSVYENPAHALANGDMLVYDSGTGWTNVETSSILSGYATQSWVTSQGYITASALNGYATQSWVTSQGYIQPTLSNLANGDVLIYDSVGSWVNTNLNTTISGFGYITSSALSGYATETWVTNQGYITASALNGYIHPTLTNLANGDVLIYDSVGSWVNTNLNTTISGFGYITSSALSGYATETWVTNQGYITASALNGYIHPTLTNLANGDVLIYDSVGSWVNAPLDTTIAGFGYITSSALANYLPLTGGTVTGAVNLATNSGNVGIGTSSPFEKLDVNGSIISNRLRIWGDEVSDDSKGIFIQASDKTNRAYITYNGNISADGHLKISTDFSHIIITPASYRNVGINTTSPAYKLDVNGTLNATTIYQNGTAISSLFIAPTLSNLSNGDVLIYDSVGAWVNANLNTTVAGFGYITSSGSCAYATSAGSANILGHTVYENQAHSLANGDMLVYDSGTGWTNVETSSILSGYATQSWVNTQLANYLPLTGGTLSGKLIIGNIGSYPGGSQFEVWSYLANEIDWVANFRNYYHVNYNDQHGVGIRLTLAHQTENGRGFGLAVVSASSWETYTDFIITKCNGGFTEEVLRIKSSGNIGIGTSNPLYKLAVSGSANFTELYENKYRVITTANIGSQSVNYATSAGSANILGHGVSENTAHSLSNGDTLVYDAGVAWVNVASGLSDIRQKSVINYNAEPMFEAVANAPAIRFTWKDATYSFRRGIHVGSIAQYWQTTIPEAVTMDNEGMLSMQYDVIALLSTISVAKKVSEHERRIVILERENEELRKELAALKSA